ncbi:hypothetical protein FKM82_003311 [Ascaphus truei]
MVACHSHWSLIVINQSENKGEGRGTDRERVRQREGKRRKSCQGAEASPAGGYRAATEEILHTMNSHRRLLC